MSSTGKIDKNLRKEAEARVAAMVPELKVEVPADPARLLHDLRVHQIELEMQNEELRSSRDELELARDQYAILYNQSPLGYLSLDSSGVIRRVNQTFSDLVGLDSAKLVGHSFSAFLHPDDSDTFLGRYGAIFRVPEGKQLELRLKARQGTIVVQVHARKEKARDNLLIALVDITQQKKAEAYSRTLLEEKQVLLREVHHRIKNNMNIINAFLSLQASMCSSPEAVSALEEASSRVIGMMLIYDKLYRSEAFSSLSARAYLADLLDAIVAQFSSSTICVEHDIEEIMLASTILFPLGIIINELVTNAFKYAFPGGMDGCIKIRLERSLENRIVCTVSDTGIGLKPMAGKKVEGGFGFTLIDALVDQLGGKMNRSSGSGSTEFVIEFPLSSDV